MNPADLKKIRMIVCDLDGTLLNNANEISKENKSAIDEIIREGVIFTLASGRIHSSVRTYADILGIEYPVISLDGTLIKSISSDKVISRSSISKSVIKKVLKLSEKLKMETAISTGDGCFVKKKKSNGDNFFIKKVGVDLTPVDELDKYLDEALEVTVNSSEKHKIQYIKNKFSFPFSLKYSAKMYRSVSSGTHFAEIRKKNVDKGSALLKLCKHFKIKPSECAVICDWYNDLSLFKTGAIKVAVANAIDELKNIADIVTEKSNNEDGVAEFIKLVLKNKT